MPPGRVIAALLFLLATACGGGGFDIPALTDDSTCEQAQDIVSTAVGEAQAYLGVERDDPALADQLIFALSAVEERPECFDEEQIQRARGLRTTLNAEL